MHGEDRASDLAFQGPSFIDLLLEFSGRETVASVKNFVADRATGRQSHFGQRKTRIWHLVRWY